jgi:glycosyltransferase involved in cell wall biosynthesis
MYLTQFVERWTIKHAAEFMVETYFGEHFVRTLNRNAKILKINNLIAPLYFHVKRNEFAAPRTILYVGRVTASKGVFELLSVFITLTESYSDICLEFIGPIHDEAERVKLKNLVLTAGLDDRVCFSGFQPLEYVVSQYASTCMMVYPSHMDTGPNAVYEAMAAGVPVVGTRVGGIPEMISHESTGLLVPVNDPEKLAVAIRYLLDHPEERNRMGKAAKKHMQKILDPAKQLKAIFSAYGLNQK